MTMLPKNPARFALERIEYMRNGVAEHAANCTKCKHPKKPARAAFETALGICHAVIYPAAVSQIAQARALLAGYASRGTRDTGPDNSDAMIICRAAAATAHDGAEILSVLIARMHDKKPDFGPIDALCEVLTTLADDIDVYAQKRTAGGLN